ncbi:hypothetical protein SBA2_260109 [Acidobacteriia bacterium SbA2]|nr:hypothetical protein SBA2_260109 [Acidobacteriia bacterium SbA2]
MRSLFPDAALKELQVPRHRAATTANFANSAPALPCSGDPLDINITGLMIVLSLNPVRA